MSSVQTYCRQSSCHGDQGLEKHGANDLQKTMSIAKLCQIPTLPGNVIVALVMLLLMLLHHKVGHFAYADILHVRVELVVGVEAVEKLWMTIELLIGIQIIF